MSYQDKLKDPRWQKMRLEIMERDGFKCRKCEAKDKTLHVHHFYYTKGAQPWEYDEEALVTLCDDCHTAIEKASHQMKLAVGNLMVSNACSIKCAVEAVVFMGNALDQYCADAEWKSPELFLEWIGHRAVDELVKDHARRNMREELAGVGLLEKFISTYPMSLEVDQLLKLNGKEVDV